MLSIDNITKELELLEQRRQLLVANLDLKKQKEEILILRNKMQAPDFWNNQEEAAKVSRSAELLQKDWDKWNNLELALAEIRELLPLAGNDATLLLDIEKSLVLLNADLNNLELLTLYNGPYDDRAAILSISTGTGGVDAQDWSQILERMYLRFTEKQGWKVEILDRIIANEAGIKSVMMKISGLRVYGNLRSENGTHRLLRNSPFNADGLRQTSFASVEIVPEIQAQEIDIKSEDLRLDVFRSSGPGGQSVNTTDSAVRLVHLPTGIVVSCQSERSQFQNKENAYAILRAKLTKLELDRREKETKNLKGQVKAEWGQQIRSYWLYGNRLVKDHRTDYSDSDVEGVLDGKLEAFIAAYLRLNAGN